MDDLEWTTAPGHEHRRQRVESEIRFEQVVASLPNSSVMVVDRDLRVTWAAGAPLVAAGYDPSNLLGRLLEDVLPARAWQLLGPRYQEVLNGNPVDFEYDSPIGGRQFQIRARPLTDSDAAVTGFLMHSEDVSEHRARASQLEQLRELAAVGSCRFDRTSGWQLDSALAALWGISAGSGFAGIPIDLVPPEDRQAFWCAWDMAVGVPGRHCLPYRIRHGRTGQLRHLQSMHETVIDKTGRLTRVISTHVDVTDTVLATELAEMQRAAAAEERLMLLRRVIDSVATSRLSPDELMFSVANLAATTIGGGAAIRILSPDLRFVERDVVAHPDESVRRSLAAALRRTADWAVPTDGIPAEVIGRGRLVSRLRPDAWKPEYQRVFTERVFEAAADFMIAPVRHNGTVLGMMTVVRTDPTARYQPGDDDVLQLLADGAGAAVAEVRLASQHHGLLEQLASMENRERHLLAESIHDEPIQHLTAGIMRLDLLISRVDPDIRAELDQVVDQLETTAGWLRNLIMVALSPPELTAGLGPALESLARGIFADTPTVLTVIGPHHVPLTVPAKETAYRVFREALLNVRKHARATNISMRFEEHQDVVVLSLTDDGIGSADIDDSSHLGIAAMRIRAEADGGLLTVESIEGLGTTVTLTLPQRVGRPTAEPSNLLPGQGADGRSAVARVRTVVVCDDQQVIRDALRLLLDDVSEFVMVAEAADGETCLDRVRETRPDLLIMDFSMPGGGPNLVKAVKGVRRDTHVIIFTGRQDNHTREAMLRAGADQYVVKNGRPRVLLEALRRALSRTSKDAGRPP